MKYYILAGEASGDLHASNLIKEINLIDPQAQFRGFGGDLMEKAGMTVLKHYRDMAFMGLVPVVMNIRTIKKNFKFCEQDLLAFHPDVLILVDYPGFNLRMAKFAKAHGIRTFYYISPKIWAWKEARVHKVKAYVDDMFTILPFETEFYRKYNYPVNYVGNPLLDAILQKKTEPDFPRFFSENKLLEKPVLALLPGSRRGEISVLLPTMLAAAAHFPEFQCVIAGAPNMGIEFYQPFMKGSKVPVLWGRTYEILIHSRIAIVSSGTATLETAILNVPQVVVYQMTPNWLFKYLKFFLITKWVSLVNIILQKEAVTELIQSDFTLKNIVNELNKILHNPENEKRMLDDYCEMMGKLGEPGASKRAATLMVEKLKWSVETTMNKKICIGFFKDFQGEDSILISADIYGLLEIEGVFLKLADGLAAFNFSDIQFLDKNFRIHLVAYIDTENIGLRLAANGEYEWRATKEKWSEFRQKLTALYRNGIDGHQYLDSGSVDNIDLQVVFSLDEYSMSFWEQQ